jgi:hypothetical protein
MTKKHIFCDSSEIMSVSQSLIFHGKEIKSQSNIRNRHLKHQFLTIRLVFLVKYFKNLYFVIQILKLGLLGID